MIKLLNILKETQSKFSIDKSSIHGEGLFTNVDIPLNTKVLAIGDVTRDPKHILTSYGKKINHSPNPNIEIKIIDDISYIYSIKPIKANEELVADYTKLPEPFDRSTKFLNELEINNLEQIISSNKVLIKYLKGDLIGKNKSELIELLQKLIPYKNKLPNILKPKGTTFYRVDVIEKTSELEQNIIENGIIIKDKPYIRHLNKLNADLLKNIEYKPKDIVQGWTSEEEFVWEHWYNVYIHNQGGDYIFDNEKYFAAVYITNDLKDFIFNEDWLDELRSKVGGNGYEKESLRLGKSFNCDVIVINDIFEQNINELEINKPEFSDNERLIMFLNKNKKELIDKLISKLIIRRPIQNDYPIDTYQFKELLNKYAQFDIDGGGDVNIDTENTPVPVHDGVSFSLTDKTSRERNEKWKPLEIANKTIYYITY